MANKINIQQQINDLYKLDEKDIHDYFFNHMDAILMCDRQSVNSFLSKHRDAAKKFPEIVGIMTS